MTRRAVSRACGHARRRTGMWRRGVQNWLDNTCLIEDRLVCIDCGFWLSLGESNDAPDEVKVEMEAAAKVTGPGWMVDPHAESLAFAHGWNNHVSIWPGEGRLWQTAEYAVGYLARCIHDHDRITEHGND
jgi:hypothetical protein